MERQNTKVKRQREGDKFSDEMGIDYRLKIIFLSASSQGKNLKHYDLNDDNFFVGSWSGLFARRLKKYRPGLDISVWRVEPVVNKPFSKKIFDLDGIIWPHNCMLIKNVLSVAMYLKILKLSYRYRLIVHYHSLFDRFILIRFLLPPNVKIVLSHHGGVPPVKGSLKDLMFRLTYRYASGITYLSSQVREYLQTIKVPERKIHFLPVGADFDIFRPADKDEARKKLGLDPDKIYAIYVGSFYKLKSVDIILNIYHTLKDKYNFSVIFVGGEDDVANDLYNDVRDSGCPYYGRQHYKDMPQFYHSANFYIHPAFDTRFGGLDVSWIEALACNIPVLSSQLNYLDFDYSEMGIAIDNESDSLSQAEAMIWRFRDFNKCRTSARQYLDSNDAILHKLLSVYSSF